MCTLNSAKTSSLQLQRNRDNSLAMEPPHDALILFRTAHVLRGLSSPDRWTYPRRDHWDATIFRLHWTEQGCGSEPRIRRVCTRHCIPLVPGEAAISRCLRKSSNFGPGMCWLLGDKALKSCIRIFQGVWRDVSKCSRRGVAWSTTTLEPRLFVQSWCVTVTVVNRPLSTLVDGKVSRPSTLLRANTIVLSAP